jgi:hypothetical protein
MANVIYPRVTDQVLHFAVAVAIFTLFFQSWWGSLLSGAALGLIREFTEAGGSRISLSEIKSHFGKLDPWVDICFWAFGGLFASMLLF